MFKYVNKFRRLLGNKIYKQKKWKRENRLSVNGIFDYALNNKSKREIIRELSTSSAGHVSYHDPPYSSIDIHGLISDCHINDVYTSDYIDESELIQDEDKIKLKDATNAERNNNQVYHEAKRKYLLNHVIPELVSCKVFKVKITDEKNEKQIISDIDALIEMNIYERKENNDKNYIPYLFTYNSEEYEITGIEYGDRFDYAVQALKATYDIDIEHEYAPNYFK